MNFILFYFNREGLEDPLDDLGMVRQQLEQLSIIGRCEYQKTCSLLVQLFDQSARTYQELLTNPAPAQMDVLIQEGIYILCMYLYVCIYIFNLL